MQQVTDWLEKLGLGQYAQRFAENDIDFAVLTKLTDANLKELDVTSLGHRMRLVSKRLGSTYRSGRVVSWLKVENPAAPAVKREAEEDWNGKPNRKPGVNE
jgi:SAM domain (Sterile alpha motif)